MNWAENLTALARLLGDSAYEQDPDLIAVLPSAIIYADNRICRDLDLLSTRVTDDSGRLTANRRQFVLPTDVGTFIVLENLRAIVGGVYGQPLLPTSRETIDMMFPSEVAPSQPSIPTMWAPIDQETVIVGPPPDQNYLMSAFGTQRPAPLTPQSQTGTFISTQLSDLFLAAQMCWLFGGWQRNWSPQADDPATASGWESEYSRLLSGASSEELRKKLQANGWTGRLPSNLATPPQT